MTSVTYMLMCHPVTLYWTGIMASPIPNVKSLAAWESTYVQGTVSYAFWVHMGGALGLGIRSIHPVKVHQHVQHGCC
jgi:hypothetical protein